MNDGKSKKHNNQCDEQRQVATESAKPKPLPAFKDSDGDGIAYIHIDNEETLTNLFGGGTREFSDTMLRNCLNLSGNKSGLENDRNDAIAIVDGIAPRDGIEAMLATQMAATHIALIRHSASLACSNAPQNIDMNEKIFNKLARTFTTQMEALRKHRNGGKQTVTVQHVNVEDGGQAIVGNVSRGEGCK